MLCSRLKQRVRELKRQIMTVYFASRDPRMPLLPKLLAGIVVGYALSPIDLIPDFIPLIGWLDDLILLPLGLFVVTRLIPEPIFADAKKQAAGCRYPVCYPAAICIVLIWLTAIVGVICLY